MNATLRARHTPLSEGHANVLLSTAPTSSCRLSSFTWAVSCDKSSLWEASARTLTVVSASWSHLRKVSSSLRDICSPFSSLSRWAWRSFTLSVDMRQIYIQPYEENSRFRMQRQTLAGRRQPGVLVGFCSPVVDAAPDSVVLICDLLDPPGVISRILMQKMSRQLTEPCHCCLASTQVLQEGLKTGLKKKRAK